MLYVGEIVFCMLVRVFCMLVRVFSMLVTVCFLC